ncbi:hypothetical protein [Streptomyces sp. NPDC056672]
MDVDIKDSGTGEVTAGRFALVFDSAEHVRLAGEVVSREDFPRR